jgi:hypothetical protein
LLYATQVSVGPPTFILFVNNAKLMKDSYRRYIEKKLRENFEFEGTPLVVVPRSREEKKGGRAPRVKSDKPGQAPHSRENKSAKPSRAPVKKKGK